MKKTWLIFAFIPLLLSCRPGEKYEGPLPADKNAGTETRELLARLKSNTGKGFMIGHQDSPAYGIGWKAGTEELDSDVKRICGDFPAIVGWDLGWLELDSEYNLDSVSFDFIKNTIIQISEMGGINTISWHSNNPVTGESTWSPVKTISRIFSEPENLEKYHDWLGKLAGFLLSLKKEDGSMVPVIFRPYHENDGSWFWWGKDHCTSDEYRQLWHYAFHTLTEEYGVHNLLFAYSPNNFTNREEYLDRYPGDEYVDILGFDLYYGFDSHEKYISTVASNFKVMKELATEKNKLFAFTETGFEGIPAEKWYTGTVYPLMKESGAAWVLFWRNYSKKHHYVPYPGHPAAEDFKDFCSFPESLMLSDLQ